VGTYDIQATYQPIAGKKAQLEAGATPIRINEVGAANDIFINEYFKKNDWVELYNATDEAIDVAGMYLSDNPGNPQKYRISAEGGSASTIIPARGYRIVWCDKLAPLHQLHANFKLDNADGAYLSLQAEDGAWADEMTYLAQDLWQTYGRYPDGGYHAQLFDRASIGLPNQMGTYHFDEETSDAWIDQQLAITLQLQKGWNWVSHNMQEKVSSTRFTPYATTLASQTTTATRDAEQGWMGKVADLLPTEGYKVEMMQTADVTLRGQLFDATTPVALQEGWNWKGFPLYNATSLTTALEDYSPQEGDAIVGKEGFSVYANDAWRGTLNVLTPGRAYMMYAGAAQKFAWRSLTPPALTRKSKVYAAPESAAPSSALDYDLHAYPDVMSVIATVRVDEEALQPAHFTVAAFCGEECRGVSEVVDDRFYIHVHGVATDEIRFELLHASGERIRLGERMTFVPLRVAGSHQAPWELHPDATASVQPLEGVTPVKVAYFNLSGQQISQPQAGFYLQRTTYSNGSVQTTKRVMR
jgi:hypothetical protein